MGDKTEAISQVKQVQEALKQEEKREKAEEKKEEKLEQTAKAEAAKPVEKKAEAKKVEEKKEAKPAKKFVLERVYTVPLIKAYAKPRSHRARVAVSLLRKFVAKHAKAKELKNVSIDGAVNSVVLARGARNPPKRVKILAQKDEAGKVMVSLPAGGK